MPISHYQKKKKIQNLNQKILAMETSDLWL